MTIQDIISHQYSAVDFYARLQCASMAQAANEPLKLGELVDLQNLMQRLRSGKIMTFGETLCFLCINALCGLYRRKTPLSEDEKEYLAKEMATRYRHWSVLDLPTFVHMCSGGRLPSTKLGETEYELIVLDIPSILGKLEVYDRMRPNPQALQGISPDRTREKPLTDWHLHHKMDGSAYTWPSYQDAWNYWKAKPNMKDPAERNFIEGVVKRAHGMVKG